MSVYTRIIMQGDWQHPIAEVVKQALEYSVSKQALPAHINFIDGMSGKHYREFINKLVKTTSNARYLEIGSWAGSTACAALYNNNLKLTCVDNWSEFGGPKDVFFKNINNNKNNNTDFTFIEDDFRSIDYSNIGKFNIYLFDGPHDYEDQYEGVMIADEALDDEYVLIVDDFNWSKVRKGTFDGIRDLGHKVISSIEIRTTEDDSHPQLSGKNSNWHNGYFIAVISKNLVESSD